MTVGFNVAGLVPGQEYTAFLQFWAEENTPVIGLQAGATLGEQSGTKEEPVVLRAYFFATASTHLVALVPLTSTSNSGFVWIQGMMVVAGHDDRSYFDGDSLGAEWLGAANNSISHMLPSPEIPTPVIQLNYNSAWIE